MKETKERSIIKMESGYQIKNRTNGRLKCHKMSSGYFRSRAGDTRPESLEDYVWFGGLWGETACVCVCICTCLLWCMFTKAWWLQSMHERKSLSDQETLSVHNGGCHVHVCAAVTGNLKENSCLFFFFCFLSPCLFYRKWRSPCCAAGEDALISLRCPSAHFQALLWERSQKMESLHLAILH